MICRWLSSSSTGSSSPCADRMSDIHTALPPEPVMIATRLPRGRRQYANAAEEREGQGAALTADGDRLRLAALRQQRLVRVVEHRTEGRHQRLQRVDQPFRIRPGDDHTGALGDRPQRDVALSRLVALLL